jgi:hypothetical protein
MLNSSDLKVIELLKRESETKVRQKYPNLFYMLLATALKSGGTSKTIGFLDRNYYEFCKLAEKIDPELILNLTEEQISEFEEKALYYLFLDQFRPIFELIFYEEFTKQKQEFDDLMDKRILYAANKLQLVRYIVEK